jgi:beta-fructofuranosidase
MKRTVQPNNRVSKAGGQGPLADASALWQMGEVGDALGQTGLRAVGDAAIGVPLQGAELEASLRRGGDGKVARLEGGHLVAGGDARKPPALVGREATLCVRLRCPSGHWDGPILGRQHPEEANCDILYVGQVNHRQTNYQASHRLVDGTTIEFLWRTEPLHRRVLPEFIDTPWYAHLYKTVGDDFLNGVLRVGAPVELLGADRWHDVIVRFRNANLELFVDGVLVDEEWPHGALHGFYGPFLFGASYRGGELRTGFRGLIDHVAMWQRALNDDEISVLSGGRDEIAHRQEEILGPERGTLQYWLPRGHNTFVGDTMPFYHDGRFHLYYLYDRRRHMSKWGMGAHQFAHVSSQDLVHWRHHPMALSINEQWECSLGTGCHVYRDGILHQYYIHHGKRCYFKDSPYLREAILLSTSGDGLHFQKDPRPVVSIDYREFGDVNPDVIPYASGNGYWLSLSGWKIFSSPDLRVWDATSLLRSPEDIPRGICCSIFRWNGWHYYMWDNGEYRFSRDPIAPGWRWSQPDHPSTQEGLGVPKVAAFTGNRFLLVGFLGGNGYAGEVVFRELVQLEDGRLGTRFPPEMIPSSGAVLSRPFTVLSGQVESQGDSIHISAPHGVGMIMMEGVPADIRMTLRVEPGESTASFGICVRGQGNYEKGCELRFEPSRSRVQYDTPASGRLSFEAAGKYGTDFSIEGVHDLDLPFTLELVVKDDLVDACIDNRRTIISRRVDRPEGDRLFLFCQGGHVTFHAVEIRPLT